MPPTKVCRYSNLPAWQWRTLCYEVGHFVTRLATLLRGWPLCYVVGHFTTSSCRIENFFISVVLSSINVHSFPVLTLNLITYINCLLKLN